MAYKVRFRITRASETQVLSETINYSESDVGTVPALVTEHGGTVEYSSDGLVRDAVYTFPDQDSWQTFYNAALPVWNRNNVVESLNNASSTLDVSVIENT